MSSRAFLVSVLVAAALAACYDPSAIDFTSEDGKIKVNGQVFRLKGINWFGYETTNNVFHGLWSRDYKDLLEVCRSNNFNAMRVPFWQDLMLNDGTPVSIGTYNMNADLVGLTSLQVLDKVVKAAADMGILIMFDMHSFKQGSFMDDGMWYDKDHPESLIMQTWDKIIERYKDQWNVFAFDLKNELHKSTWATGNQATDWDGGAARIGEHILNTDGGSRFLIFVEGIGSTSACTDTCFWGENLVEVKNHPVAFSAAHKKKLVYSPHVYGPSVSAQAYFSDPTYPANMPAIWDAHWGYIPGATGNAIAIGEWGGDADPSTVNGKWMAALIDYLKKNDHRDQFFWCLNPNSGDTGGFLGYDWTTVDEKKRAVLADLQPNPTKISVVGGKVCFDTVDVSDVPVVSSTTPVHSSSTPVVVSSNTPVKSSTPAPEPSSSSDPQKSSDPVTKSSSRVVPPDDSSVPQPPMSDASSVLPVLAAVAGVVAAAM